MKIPVLPDFERIADKTVEQLLKFDAAEFERLVQERLRALDAAHRHAEAKAYE